MHVCVAVATEDIHSQCTCTQVKVNKTSYQAVFKLDYSWQPMNMGLPKNTFKETLKKEM